MLLLGFTSAGLLSLSQSIGVIIGANISTTITAQIVGFKLYEYGLLMIALDFVTEIMAQRDKIKQSGIALMGLRLIFLGMDLMSNATGPLRAWPPSVDVMQNLQHPLFGILIEMIFRAIVQSSSATIGIVIVLASQELISLESASD